MKTWEHFHSKPSTCKAIRWDNEEDTLAFLKTINPAVERRYVDCLFVPTREGNMIAYPGNWIVEDVIKGIYPCDERVFNKRWEGIKKKTTKRRSEARPKHLTEEVVNLIAEFNATKDTAHYAVLADLVWDIKRKSGMSERDLVNHLELSKSEVHRMVVIGSLPGPILKAVQKHNTEKYVLLEWDEISMFDHRFPKIQSMIMDGTITKRTQLHIALKTL